MFSLDVKWNIFNIIISAPLGGVNKNTISFKNQLQLVKICNNKIIFIGHTKIKKFFFVKFVDHLNHDNA